MYNGERSDLGMQTEPLERFVTQSVTGGIPTETVTAIKLSRHTGMDCRYPEHGEVNLARPPWPQGSGIPCRNDGFFLNLMAVTETVGTILIVSIFICC